MPTGNATYNYSDHAIKNCQNNQNVILRVESERTFLEQDRLQQTTKIDMAFNNQNQVRNTILGFVWDGKIFEFYAHRPGRYISTRFDLFPQNANAVLPFINIATKRNNNYVLDVDTLFTIASIFRYCIENQANFDAILTAA